jgi:hypothetical protein
MQNINNFIPLITEVLYGYHIGTLALTSSLIWDLKTFVLGGIISTKINFQKNLKKFDL